MTGCLKYEIGILNIYSQLKFPEEDVFQALGLLNIIFKMTGSLKYKPGILIFISQLKFPEEDVFKGGFYFVRPKKRAFFRNFFWGTYLR